MDREGFTLWFTGWSGSGKTTLAVEIEKELRSRDFPFVQRLDGDTMRNDLCSDLGFSKKDRDENIRRATCVAELLSKNGVATLVSFISPYRAARREARKRCHRFIEVYVRCDRDTLVSRDVKGLYKKAISGEIAQFTGLDDPYEEPENPEIIVDTASQTSEESKKQILQFLEKQGII